MTLSRLGSSVCNAIASIDWANDKHVIMCYKTEGIDCMQKLHPDSASNIFFIYNYCKVSNNKTDNFIDIHKVVCMRCYFYHSVNCMAGQIFIPEVTVIFSR